MPFCQALWGKKIYRVFPATCLSFTIIQHQLFWTPILNTCFPLSRSAYSPNLSSIITQTCTKVNAVSDQIKPSSVQRTSCMGFKVRCPLRFEIERSTISYFHYWLNFRDHFYCSLSTSYLCRKEISNSFAGD